MQSPFADPAEGVAVGILGGVISFGVGIVLDIIGAIFGGLFGGGDVAKVAKALNQLAVNTAKALDTLTRFALTVARGLGALLVTLHDLFVLALTRMWAMLKELLGAVKKVLTEALPAIAKAVRAARDAVNKIYSQFIRPLLNWIQRARRYLAILRALHVPFADKIDKALARVEARIIGPFLYVLRTLNGIGGWVNVILTAGGVIQRPLFLRTMYAYQADWVNLWWVAQQPGSAISPSAAGVVAAAPPTSAQVRGNFDVWRSSGGGPFAATVAQSQEYGNRALAG